MATAMEPAPFSSAGPLTDWVPGPLRRWSVDEYEAMVATGAISGPVHLINGYVVEKGTHHPPHAVADEVIGKRLVAIVPPGWTTRAGKPVRLPSQASEPEPDRAVVRGAHEDYEDRHPGPEDIALVVEVSDSSLRQDRKMAEIYGRAGIPLYWIVNLVDRQIEVYSEPGPEGYQSVAIVPEDERVPLVIEGKAVGAIAVADVLPPRPVVGPA